MTVYVNNDWESVGVRSVNAGPQPGVAEIPLDDNHPAVLSHVGGVSPEVQADRDMNSSVAQTIFTELSTTGPDRARVRQALIDRPRGNGVRVRNPTVGRR